VNDNYDGDILETPCKKALKTIQIMRIFTIAESLSLSATLFNDANIAILSCIRILHAPKYTQIHPDLTILGHFLDTFCIKKATSIDGYFFTL